MKWVLLFALLLPMPLMAQTTRTAASANESDVAATIALSSNGDTVQIPCSSPTSVIWTSTLSVSASIRITALGATPNSGPSTFGAGTNCLTIRHNVPNFGPLFQLTPTYAATNNVTTVENINIDPFTASTGLGNPFVIEGTGTSSGMPQVRVDNIVFGNAVQWNETGNTFHSVQMLLVDNVIGVVDHSTLPTGSAVELSAVQMSSYLGVGLYGDNSWAQPDSMGGANNWFEENNSIYLTSLVLNDCTESGPSFAHSGGCRVVNRFNHVTENSAFALTGVHGTDTGGRLRSGRHTETYGNTVACISSLGCGDAFASFRGGTGIVFGNTGTLSGGGFFGQMFDATPYRVVYSADQWGSCGNATSGTSVGGFVVAGPFDTNDGVDYFVGTLASVGGLTATVSGSPGWTTNQWIPSGAPYSVWDVTQNFVAEITSNTSNSITMLGPISEQNNVFFTGDTIHIRRSTVCMDQGGRGQGGYVSGIPPVPSGPLNQALDPIYEWDDSLPTPVNNFTPYSGKIIANRDYYTDGSQGSPQAQTSPTSPFNGATGVGFGTLANRPTTCTAGVGYFATDQGSWNTGGNGFGQGELFICGPTNTWALNYGGNPSGQPYAYPHPLTGGASQVAMPVFSPTTGTPPQTVTITTATPGGVICYTSDGSTPAAATPGTCSHGTTYSGPVSVTVNPTTLNAIGTKTGFINSFVGSSTYSGTSPACGNPSQVGPNFSNTYTCSGSTCTSSFGVTAYPISVGFTPPDSCVMHATFDGSAPTCASPSYGGTTLLRTTEVIRVIDCLGGSTSSGIVGGTWTVNLQGLSVISIIVIQ